MNKTLEAIQKIGIVPVVVLNDAKDARPLAKALCEGGLPCAEVTYRTAAAEESIRIMTQEFPEMLVGAGTVLTTEQVDTAVAAGAKFIVSPGLNPKIVKYCIEKGVPVTPGVSSPSQVEQAIEMGLDVVKFFPAEPAGGLPMIKAMAAPYTNMKFMPTGGISAKNLNEYLAFPKILACGGSWMVKGDLVAAGRFDEIAKMTREAVMTMLGLEIKKVNIKGAEICEQSVFASMIHGEKEDGKAEKGYIEISTNSVLRARHYMESQGMHFDDETEVYEKDRIVSVFVKEQINGFAVKLVQR